MILTDEEKDTVLRKCGILANLETLRLIVESAEIAVLSKLAAGVRVEPEKMGIREVDWNEFEPVYGYSEKAFNTAIAAERVLALEEAARLIYATSKYAAGDAAAIRALA